MSESPPALKTQIPPLIPRGPDWIDKPGVGAESFLGNFVDSAHVILMLPALDYGYRLPSSNGNRDPGNMPDLVRIVLGGEDTKSTV